MAAAVSYALPTRHLSKLGTCKALKISRWLKLADLGCNGQKSFIAEIGDLKGGSLSGNGNDRKLLLDARVLLQTPYHHTTFLPVKNFVKKNSRHNYADVNLSYRKVP